MDAMSSSGYTDTQLEIANALRSLDVPQSNIDEIISMLKDVKPREETDDQLDDLDIRIKLLSETDWRKRAALSALLISRSL